MAHNTKSHCCSFRFNGYHISYKSYNRAAKNFGISRQLLTYYYKHGIAFYSLKHKGVLVKPIKEKNNG